MQLMMHKHRPKCSRSHRYSDKRNTNTPQDCTMNITSSQGHHRNTSRCSINTNFDYYHGQCNRLYCTVPRLPCLKSHARLANGFRQCVRTWVCVAVKRVFGSKYLRKIREGLPIIALQSLMPRS